MKPIGRCETCKKIRWNPKRRTIQTPAGRVTSLKSICKRCAQTVEKAVQPHGK